MGIKEKNHHIRYIHLLFNAYYKMKLCNVTGILLTAKHFNVTFKTHHIGITSLPISTGISVPTALYF